MGFLRAVWFYEIGEGFDVPKGFTGGYLVIGFQVLARLFFTILAILMLPFTLFFELLGYLAVKINQPEGSGSENE